VNLESEIKKSIKYARKFRGGLTRRQLFQRLITPKPCSFGNFVKALPVSLRLPRCNNGKYRKEKLEKAKRLALEAAEAITEISFIGVSGSVAAGYPKRNDDIDWLLITENNNMWKCRFKLWRWFKKKRLKHRSYGSQELADAICPNMWLEENYLTIPGEKQNLKSAMDLIMLKPVIDKGNFYRQLLLKNSWAKKYVANGYMEKIRRNKRKISERRPVGVSNIVVNWAMFLVQRWYMATKISKEKVSYHQAFFHQS
jgi:hypothetical protein